MIDKVWTAPVNTIPSEIHDAKPRPKLTIKEQIEYMRDVKGIKFEIVNEQQAEQFLSTNNYYFKIKAFSKNFSTYKNGSDAGKYFNLDFAYLQELSTLDMYLREIILSITLDIEHFLKVRLLRDISENEKEDGYAIVEEFLSWQPSVKEDINKKSKDSYCEDLINKYQRHFPVWAFVEVLSFGDLINFCDCYYKKYPAKDIQIGNLRIVKFLRNAAAHNNCLINNLADNTSRHFTQNRIANAYVASIDGISAKTRDKKMGNRTVHDFVVMLCCFENIVTSEGVKKYTIQKLQRLFNERFTRHKEYFSENMLLRSNYEFVKKVIDKIAETCV